MKYRKFAKYVSEEEVQLLLDIIDPGFTLVRVERELSRNFLLVYYRITEEEEERKLDFLPDCIYDGDNYYEQANVQYEYFQYTMAKGYSEYWKDNPYI